MRENDFQVGGIVGMKAQKWEKFWMCSGIENVGWGP